MCCTSISPHQVSQSIFCKLAEHKELSQSVYVGEVMCLLGDNSASKSTLIKILSGVHRPRVGRYLAESVLNDPTAPDYNNIPSTRYIKHF